MKILISPQSFKGSMSALDVSLAIVKGVLRVFPDAEIISMPLADGGEGTLDVLVQFQGGAIFAVQATGPLGEMIEVPWGVTAGSSLAVIELAKVCGLSLIAPEQLNPLLTTTFGLGEVIEDALDRGMRHFFIGLGDSATNDGGTGMAKALGARFLDSDGVDLPLGGGALAKLSRIDLSGLDPRLKESQFIIGCDVNNPLLGEKGASLIYSLQKGAGKEEALQLEEALKNLAAVIEQDLGIDVRQIPSGGAAGGAGAGLHAFLHGELQVGVDWIMEKIRFARLLEGVDLVITGEGCIDSKTVFGKAPVGVAKLAKSQNIPVLAIAGMVGDGAESLHFYGIDAMIPISFTKIEPQANSFELIAQATEEAMRCLEMGKKIAL
jgi:glycerate kinase